MSFRLPKWYDLHTHFRQGPNLATYIQAHLEMGCAGALAMPNTLPPISRVSGEKTADSWSIESYRDDLLQAGADQFAELIIPLYLTKETTPEMIREGAESGVLKAAKYYPPHGTTNSEHGVPMAEFLGGDVFRTMEECGVTLCIHGEQHGLSGSDYLDASKNAEDSFYREWMPRLLDQHPNLRISCEHITTKTAATFVEAAPDSVGATITPQHLLYTLGNLIQGLKYHLYCLPIVKFVEDRDALQQAATKTGQTKFYAGTDSAPHTTKATECGCAAGCFTGGCAPQLYAMGFEAAGVNLDTNDGVNSLRRFLCENGAAFYNLPVSKEEFTLSRENSETIALDAPEGKIIPLPLGMNITLDWKLAY